MYKISIRTISILAMFLFSGCAQSTHDLIEDAQFTGDWSLVNKRYAAIERREARRGQSCPRGMKGWCVSRLGNEKCTCVSDAEGREMLDAMGL